LISKLEKPSKEKILLTIIPAIALLKRRIQDKEEVDNPKKEVEEAEEAEVLRQEAKAAAKEEAERIVAELQEKDA